MDFCKNIFLFKKTMAEVAAIAGSLSQEDKKNISTGVIILIISFALITITGIVLLFLSQQKKKNRKQSNTNNKRDNKTTRKSNKKN